MTIRNPSISGGEEKITSIGYNLYVRPLSHGIIVMLPEDDVRTDLELGGAERVCSEF